MVNHNCPMTSQARHLTLCVVAMFLGSATYVDFNFPENNLITFRTRTKDR